MASTRIAIGMKYKKPPYYTTEIFISSEIQITTKFQRFLFSTGRNFS